VIVVFFNNRSLELFVQKSSIKKVIGEDAADGLICLRFWCMVDDIEHQWKKLYSCQPRITQYEHLVGPQNFCSLDNSQEQRNYYKWLKFTFNDIKKQIRKVNLTKLAITVKNKAFMKFREYEIQHQLHEGNYIICAGAATDDSVRAGQPDGSTEEETTKDSCEKMITTNNCDDVASLVYSITDDDNETVIVYEDSDEDSHDNIGNTILQRKFSYDAVFRNESLESYLYIATTPYYRSKNIFVIGTTADIVENLNVLNAYRIENDKYFYHSVINCGRHANNCFDYISMVYQSARLDYSHQLFRLEDTDVSDIVIISSYAK